ncbi:MAG TPA: nucleotidyltransferase domain-containing protein [Candidatus Thermoplasmatota archaeon]|nr:nucleotidyltransferase domain-containing protein [Candidatus Thermoplasmatota archaeon]
MEDFLARLPAESRRRVTKVVVFGSVARGEAGPESDVDLLVVWDGRVEEAYRHLIPIATDVLIERGVDLSIHPFTVEEYERIARVRTGFFENVDREGVLVA